MVSLWAYISFEIKKAQNDVGKKSQNGGFTEERERRFRVFAVREGEKRSCLARVIKLGR